MFRNLLFRSSNEIRKCNNSAIWKIIVTYRHNCNECRAYSSRPQQKYGFLSRFVQQVRDGLKHDRAFKESVKKFREETDKLESLRGAIDLFSKVESETAKGSAMLRKKGQEAKVFTQEALQEAKKLGITRKAERISEEVGKLARGAAETIAEQAAVRTVLDTARAVSDELGGTEAADLRPRVYRAPLTLRMRKDVPDEANIKKSGIQEMAPNVEVTALQLHKGSRWQVRWEWLKSNAACLNHVRNMKMHYYDESDHPVARGSRCVAGVISKLTNATFGGTELSAALTELCRLEPGFDCTAFLAFCEKDVIPNILEAASRGELEVLQSWCSPPAYITLAEPALRSRALGRRYEASILDVSRVQLEAGQLTSSGPVLTVTFTSQQYTGSSDEDNSLDTVTRVSHVWALHRDPAETSPQAAWTLIELASFKTPLLI